jgi:hypothetical protein
MAKRNRLPAVGDKVELLTGLPEYKLSRGDVGKILVAYDPLDMKSLMKDYEIFFEKIDTSVILLVTEFKLL